MALELWETFKESITTYTGLSPATFFTVLALGLALYYVVSNFFGSSDDTHIRQRSRGFEEQMQPLPPPVQLGEITEEELKQYDGSDSQKPLLMAIKSQIYDVSLSRYSFTVFLIGIPSFDAIVNFDKDLWTTKMFYGPGGPYALFAGKDASRALAKMSFDDKDLNGDLTGLGVFELEALQDWEYKFMSKYVKVGTVKTTTVPVTDGTTEGQAATEATRESVADGPSESVAKETPEASSAVDTEKDKE